MAVRRACLASYFVLITRTFDRHNWVNPGCDLAGGAVSPLLINLNFLNVTRFDIYRHPSVQHRIGVAVTVRRNDGQTVGEHSLWVPTNNGTALQPPCLPAPQLRGVPTLSVADYEATLKELARTDQRHGSAAVEVTAAASAAACTAAVEQLTAAAAQEERMEDGECRRGSLLPKARPSQGQLDSPRKRDIIVVDYDSVANSLKSQAFGVVPQHRFECSGKVQTYPGIEGGQEEGAGAGTPLGRQCRRVYH